MLDFNNLITDYGQTVSYKFGDFLMQQPAALQPIALAVIQACITSQLQAMPSNVKEIYDMMLQHCTIVMMPSELDPRKKRSD